ncbi:MAG: hypothetical protein J0M10_06475 [Chitinophagales bacterium]|nr:hypothetical protein [Chitinophagales bacterium]
MKKMLCLPVFILFLSACGNNDTEPEVLPATEISLWKANLDSGLLRMEKQVVPGLDTITTESIVSYMSGVNFKPEYVKTSGDTLYLRIADATYLTQQMGSSGAEAWLAELVYNCTEIPGIRFVNLDFEEGDHAQPGTYRRESFIK